MSVAACVPPSADSGLSDTEAPGLVVVAAGAVGWVELAEKLPTVATVRWNTPLPSQGRVWVREAGVEGWAVTIEEQEPAEEHARVLRGLAAETDYHVRVEPDLDGTAPFIELELTTGALPDWMPAVRAGVDWSRDDRGGYLFTPLAGVSMEAVPTLIDSQGRVVWYHADAGHVTRSRVTPDREAIVSLRHAATVNEQGLLQWFSWDGELLQERAITGIHTDFTFLPDGGVAVLGREVRDLTLGRPILGETILELDPQGQGGVVWSILDAYPPDLSGVAPPCAEAPGAECYAHVNSISYDEAQDTYLLTASNLGAVLAVDRASGAVRWSLGGPSANLAVAGMAKPFSYPHSVQGVSGGVLVYDNWSPLLGGCSGAVEFAVDLDAGVATPGWSYVTPECIVNNFLGNAQRLWDGSTLVAIPAGGLMDRVGPGGDLAQRVSVEPGVVLRFAQAIQSLYP